MTTVALLIRLLAPPADVAWDAAKAHYLSLTQAQSESCSELTALALAGCQGEDDSECYLDYVPQSCGGRAQP